MDLPIRSLISVCSDKLIRTNLFPVKDARAATMEDFPTPGLPSIKIAEEFFNWKKQQKQIDANNYKIDKSLVKQWYKDLNF